MLLRRDDAAIGSQRTPLSFTGLTHARTSTIRPCEPVANGGAYAAVKWMAQIFSRSTTEAKSSWVGEPSVVNFRASLCWARFQP